MTAPLWNPTPQRIEAANITQFAREMSRRWELTLDDYAQLHRWSVDEPVKFWRSLWSFCDVLGDIGGQRWVQDLGQMPGAQWFPDAHLNFSENLLRRRDDRTAMIFRAEDQVRREWTYAQLYSQVAGLAAALRRDGVGPGDRVCGYLPNMPESVIAALATATVGAVWSSCSPDFGVQGVLDRFGQIEPTVLFSADGYYYAGQRHSSIDRLVDIRAALPTLRRVVVVPLLDSQPNLGAIDGALCLEEYAPPESGEIDFVQLPFNHPLYILYSSGTTGVPKCIVHGAGGTLLQHLKEHRLHSDLKSGDRFFYFTTCGWMMWNWLVSGLATDATLLLYDGSPFYPDGNVLFDFAAEEQMTIFGTSAKFIDAAAKAGLKPRDTHDLSELKAVLSTGSPLMPESFDYVYDSIKGDVCLSSIAGGTDIVSCFVGGHPAQPVWRGEIQAKGLGMKVEVRDDDGNVLGPGHKGELTCSLSFPSMPVGFWNDADGAKYRAAYFDKFPGLWCHGDYVAETEHGGLVIYGRSDAVLNPGGVRIGTAEIYREAEQFEDVVEGLVVGQQWAGDVRIVLFVRLREGSVLTDALRDRIRKRIRANTTPRHVPAVILDVPDIPRTKSGKVVELAVTRILHGEPVQNLEALANPEALDYFRSRPELMA
ncbi:MAG: acetoacetate--CoA ligase [Pseudomonadota bacterium]|nr:acetoacetate--CoA ligase [Pseudomonadota bacterium]